MISFDTKGKTVVGKCPFPQWDVHRVNESISISVQYAIKSMHQCEYNKANETVSISMDTAKFKVSLLVARSRGLGNTKTHSIRLVARCRGSLNSISCSRFSNFSVAR